MAAGWGLAYFKPYLRGLSRGLFKRTDIAALIWAKREEPKVSAELAEVIIIHLLCIDNLF